MIGLVGRAEDQRMRSSWRVTGSVALATVLAGLAVFGFGTWSRSHQRSGGPVRLLAAPGLGVLTLSSSADVGDPDVLPVPAGSVALPGSRPAGYLLFSTTDWRSHVPVQWSANLRQWTSLPDALPRLPRWAKPTRSMTWAPSVVAVPGGYDLYVSTEDRVTGRECLAVAVSRFPAGPYQAVGNRPLVCQASLGGSIDPFAVHGPHGHLHLVWKSNGDSVGLPTRLWTQALSPSGTAVTGSAHQLLVDSQAWQGGNVEGPAVAPAAGGGWWLWYSGGQWNRKTYATGLAFCHDLTGTCRPVSSGPWLAGTKTLMAPDGVDVFVNHQGVLEMAVSALAYRRSPWDHDRWLNRVLMIAPLHLGQKVLAGTAPDPGHVPTAAGPTVAARLPGVS